MENINCAICYEEIKEETNCKTIYCKNCIEYHIKVNNAFECANCKKY